jgi:succinate dehydrogenase hydrophobic anchor subunit
MHQLFKSSLKAILFLFFLGFHLSICLAQDKDEKSIRKILDSQTEEWNKGNINSFMQGYWKSDSLLFVGKSGANYGYNKTLANYKKSYPDTTAMGKLDFNILEVRRLSPDYYFVLGKWHLKRTIGDLSGAYTLLFHKIKGVWVIVADHSS